ncbi:MAG: penicillin acylase family protein, partial [Thermoanaerobaculia bacterium]
TPKGPREFEIFEEIIEVNAGESVTLQVEETIWGPIIDRDHLGRRRALRWIAHDPQGITFAYRELELASSLEEAIEAANRIGAPPQNTVIATASGRIGWTIMGSIPRRFGHDGRLPTSWADGKRGWDGWLAPAEYPKILDPPSGRLWTANARAVGGEMMRTIGSGNYPLGARARQIRDSLDAGTEFSEIDLLQIQLDDRALFLQRWQELLLEVLSPQALRDDPRRTQLKEFVESWGGHAAVGSVGYRMVRAYRTFVTAQVLGSITAACTAADDRFRVRSLLQREGPVWQLVSERPQHLLSPGYTSWDKALLAPVDELLDYFLADGSTLADKTWGDRNTVRLRHPMSRFIPGSERWLDMPSRQLPGDSHMPRFQSPFEGASQRFVVSPGREAEGIFHMPAGQSGHPLSPHYSDGHAAWANGEPTPFLPGKTVHRLTLLPR